MAGYEIIVSLDRLIQRSKLFNETWRNAMAKYQWNGSTLVIDFEVEGLDKIEVFSNALSPEVRESAMKFGLQTALRNSTAGKMDDPHEGYKALKAKLAVFDSGVWEKAGESKGKVELSEDEKKATIAEVIIAARRAKGDQRTNEQILEAFGGLDQARQAEVIKALAKSIEKKLKQKLADKKKLGKVDGPEF